MEDELLRSLCRRLVASASGSSPARYHFYDGHHPQHPGRWKAIPELEVDLPLQVVWRIVRNTSRSCI